MLHPYFLPTTTKNTEIFRPKVAYEIPSDVALETTVLRHLEDRNKVLEILRNFCYQLIFNILKTVK